MVPHQQSQSVIGSSQRVNTTKRRVSLDNSSNPYDRTLHLSMFPIKFVSIKNTHGIHNFKRFSMETVNMMAYSLQQDSRRTSNCCSHNTIPCLSRLVIFLFCLVCYSSVSLAFTLTTSHLTTVHHNPSPSSNFNAFQLASNIHHKSHHVSYTSLNVWWFGGSSSEYSSNGVQGDDSCELVAVRIDRTSPNSRRISADILIPRPIDDVWSILTDYDQLATHVPNLVESRRVASSMDTYFLNSRDNLNNMPRINSSQPGDGTYKCRLYQKGSQKIIGFEFGASLVMDMTESIVVSGNRSSGVLGYQDIPPLFVEERKIGFKCVESQFFSEFDGEWRLQSSIDTLTGEPATLVSYVVDVRPKGPVPVAALEWRIREDVPTNLRAVKKASMEVGYEGVMNMRRKTSRVLETRASRENKDIQRSTQRAPPPSPTNSSNGRLAIARADVASSVKQIVGSAASNAIAAATNVAANRTQPKARLSPVRVQWYDDETMAKYLKKDK